MKLVICRSDLPFNARWREKGYPYANCWEPDELMENAERDPALLPEARRIYWECYWRLLGRYKRGRPFFEAYKLNGAIEPWPGGEEQVCRFVVASAMATQVVPEEAKRATFKVYRRLFAEPRQPESLP